MPASDSASAEQRAHPAEPHHQGQSGRLNWLRAAVLGANDGIISTASLIIGVASAAGSLSAAGAFTAVWLKDTRILFVSGGALAIYDPSTGAFTNVPTGIHIPEVQYQTATWTDSNVLLTEGGPAQVYGP